MNNIHGLNSQRGVPGGGPGNSFSSQVKSGWASIPLFNKFLVTSCIIIYLVSFILSPIIYYTVLMPGFIIRF